MKNLGNLSKIQFKHSNIILVIVLFVTLLLVLGLGKISVQSNMDEMMPQDLEIFKLSDKIEDKFGAQGSSIILLQIEDAEKEGVYDIRDPEIMEFLVELESRLSGEELVEGIQSAGMVFTKNNLPESLKQSKKMLERVPEVNAFFNDDYSATMVSISSDLESEENIVEIEETINQVLSEISNPKGMEVYVTGTPQIRTMMLDLLVDDAVFTLLIASIIIFAVLIVLQKSFTKALLVFIPLLLGIVWTLGAMGWLGIELSTATVGIGAMILGLGVEYGVFIVSRYTEERHKKSAKKSLETTVREVGGSVLGSGSTTVMGFLALTLSSMPMLRDLGLSLALGIGFSLLAAVFVNPAMIVLEEKFEIGKTDKQHKKITKKAHHERRKKLDEKTH